VDIGADFVACLTANNREDDDFLIARLDDLLEKGNALRTALKPLRFFERQDESDNDR